jgi:hypothetical protein
MKVEFEYPKKPMPLNEDTVNFLKRKGTYFFCIIRSTKTVYNREKFRDETVTEDKIEILQIFPTITILNHDFFRANNNVLLVGYCSIEIPGFENKIYL